MDCRELPRKNNAPVFNVCDLDNNVAMIRIPTASVARTTAEFLPAPPIGDNVVHFFPTCARLSPGGDYWQIAVRGRVVTPRPDNLRKTMLMHVLRRALNVSAAELASPIFRDRVADFLMLGLRDRNISVRRNPPRPVVILLARYVSRPRKSNRPPRLPLRATEFIAHLRSNTEIRVSCRIPAPRS